MGAPPGVALKIVSDIDDTLFCSGGHFPAGCDRRLPTKCLYPGALALFRELDIAHARLMRACLRRRAQSSDASKIPIQRSAVSVISMSLLRGASNAQEADASSPTSSPPSSNSATVREPGSHQKHQDARSCKGPLRHHAPGATSSHQQHAPSPGQPHAHVQHHHGACEPPSSVMQDKQGRVSTAVSDEQPSAGLPGRPADEQQEGRGPFRPQSEAGRGSNQHDQSAHPPTDVLGKGTQGASQQPNQWQHEPETQHQEVAGSRGWSPVSTPGTPLHSPFEAWSGQAASSLNQRAPPADEKGSMPELDEPKGSNHGSGKGLLGTSAGEDVDLCDLPSGASMRHMLEAGSVAMGIPGASLGSGLRQQMADIAQLVAPSESRPESTYGGDESTPETESPAGGSSPASGRGLGLGGIADGGGTPSARLRQAADALHREKTSRASKKRRSARAEWPIGARLRGGDVRVRGAKADPSPRPHQDGVSLVFLSARPESYKGLTEAESFRHFFTPLLLQRRLFCTPVLLLGSLQAGPQAALNYVMRRRPKHDQQGGMENLLYHALAAKKLSRFKEYAALYPECCFVFLGDNGQGDVMVAEDLSRLLGPRLVACFLHEVKSVLSTVAHLRNQKSNQASWLAAWRDRKIYMHRSHLGMAVQAHTLGLLDDVGLQAVALEAVTDLRQSYTRYGHAKADWARVLHQLRLDLAEANVRLPEELQLSMPEALLHQPSPRKRQSGTGSLSLR
ncbi:hypothetical protein WJX84_006379 [Apatococcus fuscideae]|uniref:Phosphatidate phosphatase APP1 catalytic domain-containing protein n=1 Tax=Apatococcus fuscideae TaxID=2026836 RepID=A0AAW1T3M1_9CHLO